MDQRGFLAADESAGAKPDVDVEVKTAVHDVVAEQTVLFAGFDRFFDPFHRQRIFRADVKPAFGGADGVGSNHHAFNDVVRVGFQNTAVHIGAGVALVAVADDELVVNHRHFGRQLPFQSGGEAGAAAAAQAGFFDLGGDFGRGHGF